jgi:hypothetical protein
MSGYQVFKSIAILGLGFALGLSYAMYHQTTGKKRQVASIAKAFEERMWSEVLRAMHSALDESNLEECRESHYLLLRVQRDKLLKLEHLDETSKSKVAIEIRKLEELLEKAPQGVLQVPTNDVLEGGSDSTTEGVKSRVIVNPTH